MRDLDGSVKSCLTETRIDHHIDGDNDRESVNSYRTIDGLAESSSRSKADSSESDRSRRKLKKRSRSASESRHLRESTTTSKNGNNGERQQSRNNRNDERQQHNCSSKQNRQDYSNDDRSKPSVTSLEIVSSLVIIQITIIDNSTTTVIRESQILNTVRDI